MEEIKIPGMEEEDKGKESPEEVKDIIPEQTVLQEEKPASTDSSSETVEKKKEIVPFVLSSKNKGNSPKTGGRELKQKVASGNQKTRKTAGELKHTLTEQMKEKKIPTNLKELNEYVDKEKLKQRKKLLFGLLGVALALIIVLGISNLLKYHTWDSYSVLASDETEYTRSYTYAQVGKNILRYGIDSARLMDADYNTLWVDSYAMSNPAIEVCGETVCIYDRSGSAIITYGKEGRIGTATSSLPIVKASVAEQGVAAVICESSAETWIKYYSTDGSEIASFRTDMDSPGYPMDLALSPDGLAMTVSYAFAEAGQINTQIAFYNFGSAGQNRVDNLVKVETYNDILAPEVQYVSNDTCVVNFENGFRVYEGVRKPNQIAYISLNQTILSYVVSTKGIGIVLKNSTSADYTLRMFDLHGKGIFSETFDFAYDHLLIRDNGILFYNHQELMLYSTSGIRKFRGAIEGGQIKTALSLGKNRYFLVDDEGIRTICLR